MIPHSMMPASLSPLRITAGRTYFHHTCAALETLPASRNAETGVVCKHISPLAFALGVNQVFEVLMSDNEWLDPQFISSRAR